MDTLMCRKSKMVIKITSNEVLDMFFALMILVKTKLKIGGKHHIVHIRSAPLCSVRLLMP